MWVQHITPTFKRKNLKKIIISILLTCHLDCPEFYLNVLFLVINGNDKYYKRQNFASNDLVTVNTYFLMNEYQTSNNKFRPSNFLLLIFFIITKIYY